MSYASNPELTPFQRTWVLSHERPRPLQWSLFSFIVLALMGIASVGLLIWDFSPELISPQLGSGIKFLLLCLFLLKTSTVFLLCLAAIPILGVQAWAIASIKTAENNPEIQNKDNPGLKVFASWYKTQTTSVHSFSFIQFLHTWLIRLCDVAILLGLIFGGHYIIGFLWLMIVVPGYAVTALCNRAQLGFIKALTPERIAIAEKINEPEQETSGIIEAE